MEQIKSADHSSIAERMQRIRMRIYLERVSGTPIADKEAFLALCQRPEVQDISVDDTKCVIPSEQDYWSDFTNVSIPPPSSFNDGSIRP